MGNYTQGALNQLSAEYEVSEVLEHFNSQYIMDVIQEKIQTRFAPNLVMSASKPNIVMGFEDNFNRCKLVYPEDIQNIQAVRTETYREVVDIISKAYGFNVRIYENIDIYWLAYQLYDFFVCNFADYVAKFFAEYIYRNKDVLYTTFNMDQYKKAKDGAIVYGKRLYNNDSKLAIILANVLTVVNGISSFDITPADIFYTIYGNKAVVDILSASLLFPYDMFKTLVYNIPEDYKPILYTNIRLELQKMGEGASADGFGYMGVNTNGNT